MIACLHNSVTFLCSAPEDYPDGYVAVCTVVKDQQQDLLEWLEYHRFIGVGKVYVYDNNSTVSLCVLNCCPQLSPVSGHIR